MIRQAMLLACLAAPVQAACPPDAKPVLRSVVVMALEQGFAETLRNFAMIKGGVVEVYASGAGTWTIIETGPDGKSCIIAAGTRWRAASPAKQGDPT